MDARQLISEYNEGQRDFSNADLYGANLRGADLSEADLSGAIGRFATGSFGKHTAIAACGYVSIGCERYTFAYWLENYETIGKANAYTAHEIARYGAWIRLVVEWLGVEEQSDD